MACHVLIVFCLIMVLFTLITINSNRPDITVKTVSYRKLKSIDINAFQLAIAVSDLCLDPPDNPEDLAMCYNNTLKKILDDHALVVTCTTINRPRVPLITEEIRASKNVKGEEHRKNGEDPSLK